MANQLQESLWRQFGASIDMLANVIEQCPDSYYFKNTRFYYLAYHTVLLLDYYLSIPPSAFTPVLGFTIEDELNRPAGSVGDLIPERTFTRQELVDYISKSRQKAKTLIDTLTMERSGEQRFTEGNREGDMDYPILEILFYNLRHTQHHVGQLHLMMRQDLDKHIDWEFRVNDLQ